MQERRVHIPNINCPHCAATIKRELEEMDGVLGIAVDLVSKSATIRWTDPLTWDDIRRTLMEIGYPPEE